MNRIDARFAEYKKQGRVALVPYVTAGDPGPDTTVPLMHAMVKAGADILELGVPFSDPMAEGPVIQKAMERALEHHVSLRDVLGMVSQFRQQDDTTPVLLMGYLNPVEIMGYEAFAEAAAKAGVDGVLLVDIPPEEAAPLLVALAKHKLDIVFLVSPTTSDERIQTIARSSSGFVYYVSLKGVTGAGHLDTDEVADRVNRIKSYTDLPVGVGFGIKDADSAARVAKVADAVVVGSALVKKIEEFAGSADKLEAAVAGLIAEIRAGIDQATV
ncbi:MAG: tryptophan synthase subunit alpha [Gammaproteobacteria bacterium]|nr:tryptophan synthase subunit alpha [Gammaproteobacteria bacterium]MDH5776902.1 tryptophan synthase subunit alpha [Gammaproteobacteria bacterium]